MLAEIGGTLAETTEYVLSAPGKLLRPLLLLEACRAAGGDPEIAFPSAAGTEYGHVASLIHDDIIDGDGERRGRATLHTTHGLATALLTGDLLVFEAFLNYTRCYERGASAEAVLAAIHTLSTTCIDMCRGQALEAAMAGDLETDEQTYLQMIALKTASVCRAATRIGAVLAAASPGVVDALSAYGYNLGMAFQIVDDLLCYDGQAARVGKPLHSDVHNRRITLPVIYALQMGDEETRRGIWTIFADRQADDVAAHAQLAELLTSARALDRTRTLSYRYTAAAKHHLAQLPPSESRDLLSCLADVFLTRDH